MSIPSRAAAVVDREQVAAGQREQLAHAVGLQAAGDQPAAVQRRRLCGSVVMAPESTPPPGGRAARWPGDARGRAASSVAGRWSTTTEPRRSADADLDLLLAETDREDPIPASRRAPRRREPREEIDAQILAGLVTPY